VIREEPSGTLKPKENFQSSLSKSSIRLDGAPDLTPTVYCTGRLNQSNIFLSVRGGFQNLSASNHAHHQKIAVGAALLRSKGADFHALHNDLPTGLPLSESISKRISCVWEEKSAPFTKIVKSAAPTWQTGAIIADAAVLTVF
jgi:hypothetical protein